MQPQPFILGICCPEKIFFTFLKEVFQQVAVCQSFSNEEDLEKAFQENQVMATCQCHEGSFSLNTWTQNITLPLPLSLQQVLSVLSDWSQENYFFFSDIAFGKSLLKKSYQDVVLLSPKETHLLTCLLTCPQQTASKDYLLHTVWGYGKDIDTHTLETHIYQLRQKLDSALKPSVLNNTENGYSLQCDACAFG